MKKIFLFMIISLFAIALIGCGNSGNQGDTGTKTKYTLTVWGSEEDQTMLKEMCQAYAKANPQNEYKFLFGVQSESDAATKVLNDVTVGPDVFSFASDQINMLIAGGALARIGGTNETTVKEINTADSVDACTVTMNGEDRLYAYPCTGDNNYFVYYDKRVFTDTSKLATLDSMLETANAAGKKVHFKLNDDGWYLSSFFFTNPELGYDVKYNENMVEESVTINYDTHPYGLEVMKSLRTYLGNSALVANTDDGKITSAFTANAEGKLDAAAAVTGVWNRKTIEGLLGENMGVCKLPKVTIAGEQVQLSGYMGHKLMGVNGYSKNKGEAHKLALWLTNQENQLKRFEMRGFGPTNKVVAGMEVVLNDPVIKVIFEQAKFNRTQKAVPSGYWTPMGSLITEIITNNDNGTETTDETLQQLLVAACESIRK